MTHGPRRPPYTWSPDAPSLRALTVPSDATARPIPEAPPESLRFHRPAAVLRAPAEIWRARAIVRALSERELRAFYKQAVLGVAWAVLTPVALMLVLTIFFQRVATIDTNGAPYALFSYLGLVPWNFFSSSVTTGGMSLVNQMALVNKIKCPREVFPLSSIVVAGFNSAIAGTVLLVLFAIDRYAPKATTPLAIFPLIVSIMFTVAVTLIVSCVTVYLRDLRHALPILMQLGFFVTPIAYSMSAIPPNLQVPYSMLNPIAPVIDSYRETILYGNAPNWTLLGAGALSSFVLLLVAVKLFRRLEMGFADVA